MTSKSRDQKISEQADELKELKQQQLQAAAGGEPMADMTANRNPKYKIRVLESKGYVHVATSVKHLTADQKDFTYEDRIVKVHAREFDRRVSEGMFKTFDSVEVIHDPRPGAPTKYNLKPDQLDVQTKAKTEVSNPNVAAREQHLSAMEKTLMNIKGDLDGKESVLKDKEDLLGQRANQLQETAVELSEREQALNDVEKGIAYEKSELEALRADIEAKQKALEAAQNGVELPVEAKPGKK